jgi:hypothetical protein
MMSRRRRRRIKRRMAIRRTIRRRTRRRRRLTMWRRKRSWILGGDEDTYPGPGYIGGYWPNPEA